MTIRSAGSVLGGKKPCLGTKKRRLRRFWECFGRSCRNVRKEFCGLQKTSQNLVHAHRVWKFPADALEERGDAWEEFHKTSSGNSEGLEEPSREYETLQKASEAIFETRSFRARLPKNVRVYEEDLLRPGISPRQINPASNMHVQDLLTIRKNARKHHFFVAKLSHEFPKLRKCLALMKQDGWVCNEEPRKPGNSSGKKKSSSFTHDRVPCMPRENAREHSLFAERQSREFLKVWKFGVRVGDIVRVLNSDRRMFDRVV